MIPPTTTTWVVSDGKAGTETQGIGLAERLGVAPVVKRVSLRTPWRQLAPWLRAGAGMAASPAGDPIAPPWPDLLISAGRHGILPSIAARRASAGRTLTVHIQDPRIDPGHFDLVASPRHDGLAGANVIETTGALHRVTDARLAEARSRFADRLSALPRPRVAVLIGGNSRAYRMTLATTDRLVQDLTALAASQGAGLMVTASRRTGPENAAALEAGLSTIARASIDLWSGDGDNPYLGYLAWADAILVTSDSATMLSEAAETMRPVHVIDLDGGNAKFRRLHQIFEEAGIARRFRGRLDEWQYEPPRDVERVAKRVCAMIAMREHQARA